MTPRPRTPSAVAFVVGMLGLAAAQTRLAAQDFQLRAAGPRFISVAAPSRQAVDASSAPAFQRRVTLQLDRVPLRLALREIGQQARLRFVSSDEVVPLDSSVSVSASHITVAAALTELLLGTGVDVQLSLDGATIALVPRVSSVAFARPVQPSVGIIAGHVTGPSNRPLAGAIVRVETTRLGAQTATDGSYRIANVPAGTYLVQVRLLGFAPDTSSVTVEAGAEKTHDVSLRPFASQLERMTVTAQRLGESKAVALEKQQNADNIVTVLSGDEIRGLPNANATEAAARIPGVSTERDEGEGKFIQIRGTEPRLSNVTVDGAHLPGTQFGERIPKLDAVPSDILAAIEVSKTLTADMDADAIGGSVNLVTKTPEGAPKGYVSAQGGQTTLLSHRQWQAGVSYGGRFGDRNQLGFLLGTSLDHNDRVISDVEPAWVVDGSGNVFPAEWSQREFLQNRTRYGIGGDLDYRYGENSTAFIKGLFTEFNNFGYRYQYDVSFSGDSAPTATTGFGTGAALFREIQNRTPRERLFGMTAGGRNTHRALTLDYTFNWAGTRQSARDYRFNPFNCTAAACPLTMAYDYSAHRLTPFYHFLSAADSVASTTTSNYNFNSYKTFDSFTSGRDLGGAANLLWRYDWGSNPGSLKFGVRLRNEFNKYTQNRLRFSTGAAPLGLPDALSGFTDPNYYSNVTSAYQLGPLPSNGAAVGYVDSHQFVATHDDSAANAAASFNGTENVAAGYVMNTIDVGIWRLNVGLRVENTHSSYTGHVVATPPSGPSTVTTVPGSQTYTDVFPSAQLRVAVDPVTDVRFAVTRGIARPNYSDLAPSLVGQVDKAQQANFGNLRAGNPNLRPQRAWNFDLLAERFLPIGGVISGGVFYKSITDFIYTRDFIYTGPVTEFVGFGGTQPQNGGSAHLVGFEGDWTQHLTFLPGILSGVGFDVNWTHVSSSANLLPTDTSAAGKARTVSVPRQSPNIANAAVLYDIGHLSARVAWQFQGASIVSYGDGSPTPNGDTYFYDHSQVDASLIYNLADNIQLQLQGLNLNNAVFGFYMGTTHNNYPIQREFYGRSLILGAKYAF